MSLCVCVCAHPSAFLVRSCSFVRPDTDHVFKHFSFVTKIDVLMCVLLCNSRRIDYEVRRSRVRVTDTVLYGWRCSAAGVLLLPDGSGETLVRELKGARACSETRALME